MKTIIKEIIKPLLVIIIVGFVVSILYVGLKNKGTRKTVKLPVVSGNDYSGLEDRIDDLESQVSDLESRVDDLESQLEDTNYKVDDNENNISDLESRIDNLEF